MAWLSSLFSLSKILHGIEVVWNKTIDYLEDSRMIELGELRAQHEASIQKSIQEKKAKDARANAPLDRDSLSNDPANRGKPNDN